MSIPIAAAGIVSRNDSLSLGGSTQVRFSKPNISGSAKASALSHLSRASLDSGWYPDSGFREELTISTADARTSDNGLSRPISELASRSNFPTPTSISPSVTLITSSPKISPFHVPHSQIGCNPNFKHSSSNSEGGDCKLPLPVIAIGSTGTGLPSERKKMLGGGFKTLARLCVT